MMLSLRMLPRAYRATALCASRIAEHSFCNLTLSRNRDIAFPRARG
jgi:hypothetical protein